MALQIKERGVVFQIDNKTNLEELFDKFLSLYNYKFHRYIHIIYKDEKNNNEIFTLISKIKQKSVLIIFEPDSINNIDWLKNLYAGGIDIFVLNNSISNDNKLLKEIMSVLPADTIVLKDNEESILNNKSIIKKMPFILEDSIFEPIKRKIWIDITNLRRKLRIKEVYDSYNASGL